MIRYTENIVIVGGGTAGWLTACSLRKSVPFAKITLIDKETSESVAVGEATLLNFKYFLQNLCKYSDHKIINLIQHCEGVQKIGILHPDWGYDGNIIWHPFQFINMLSENNHSPGIIDAWSHHQDFDIRKLLVPYQNLDKVDWKKGIYAEHINAVKLVEYIKHDLTEVFDDKIDFIQSGVKNIERDDMGISSLTLEDGSVISADLYVDCTGFKSILKDNRDRVDTSDRLYVNTAVVHPVEYIDKDKELLPYTTAQVVDHGWIWKTPLQSRIGTGMVFNRSITDIEDAKVYFCEHWNNRISPENVRVIDWTPYYDRNQWDKNVISIGLSAGFIEPLESTGIELIIQGAIKLCETINGGYYTKELSDHYNSDMNLKFEQCTDVVNMHYSKSTKDTPFWNYVRDNYKESETLRFYKDILADPNRPTMTLAANDLVFAGGNWTYWMTQFGYPLAKKEYLIGKYKHRDGILTEDGLYDIMIHESNWIQGEDYCNCSICDGAKIKRHG